MKFTVTLFLFLAFFTAFASPVWAYDPPERIWHKVAPRYNIDGSEYMQYFHEFTWLKDQNGDGCDELIVCHEVYDRSERLAVENPINIVELYFGGDPMDDEPDLIFEPRREAESMGWNVSYLGNLTGNGPYNFAIKNGNYRGPHTPGNEIQDWYIDIYEGGEQLDTEPDYSLEFHDHDGCDVGANLITNDVPCDINGDGYNDLMVYAMFRDSLRVFSNRLQIYYGGEDFDLTVDDSIFYLRGDEYWNIVRVQSGFDLNGDGCDEIVIMVWDSRVPDQGHFKLLLGGEEINPEPIFTAYPDSSYEGYYLGYFRFFSDVNGDGYDDWRFGLSYGDPAWEEETWVFFGGDTLDFEPDRSLQPAVAPLGGAKCYGGDANGDGANDVLVFGRAMGGCGDMRIFLGSPWLDEEYAVVLSGWDDWDMGAYHRTQGAYGDYNGDGAGDFAIVGQTGGSPPRLGIYGGDREWELAAPFATEPPCEYPLLVDVYPNPFNSVARVRFEQSVAGNVEINVYNQLGQKITSTRRENIPAGTHTYNWSAEGLPSGNYFLQINVESNGVVHSATKNIIHLN